MVTMTSQNSWPVLQYGSSKLHDWVIPARNGRLTLRARNGSAGFLLALFALWFSGVIEDLTGKVKDDWGHAVRPVRGQTSGYSNHASGTALDLNALKHPIGSRGTYKRWQVIKIRAKLLIFFRRRIRAGIDYVNRPDEMHFEINMPLAKVERRARKLSTSPRGRRILEANPGQKKVIFS